MPATPLQNHQTTIAHALGGVLVVSVAALAIAAPAAARWRLAALPATTDGLAVRAVSCTTTCVAVGYKMYAAHSTARGWVRDRPPSPYHVKGRSYVELGAVSCVSADACTAVGVQVRGVGRNSCTLPVIERFNGRSWSIQQAAAAIRRCGVGFSDVQCFTRRSCLALGSDTIKGRLLLARWDGRRWTARSVARVPKQWFGAMSCIRLNACAVAGSTSSGALAAWWNGRAFLGAQTIGENDYRSFYAFSDVSCVSARKCLAVGSGLVAQWDGQVWTEISAPTGGFNSVSCAAGGCLLTPEYQPALYTWSRGRFARQSVGLAEASWAAVSCHGKRCVAIAEARKAASRRFGLIAVSNF